MLDNDMLVDQIRYNPKSKEVRCVTQKEYDEILKPIGIYVITDIPGRVYYDGKLIENRRPESRYFLGGKDKDGLYTIYLLITNRSYETLVEITKWKDADLAIEMLDTYNRIGDHSDLSCQIYNILCQYIQKVIPLHNTIVGIISWYGYRDDPRLQEVIQMACGGMYRANQSDVDFNPFFRDDLKTWKHFSNPIYGYYAALYDVVTLYDLFKHKRFHKRADSVDLKEVLQRIRNVFNENINVD
jgi:hypothetical protein